MQFYKEWRTAWALLPCLLCAGRGESRGPKDRATQLSPGTHILGPSSRLSFQVTDIILLKARTSPEDYAISVSIIACTYMNPDDGVGQSSDVAY